MSAYTEDGHVTHIQRANNKCRNQAGWKAKLLSVGFATRTKLVLLHKGAQKTHNFKTFW